MPDRYEVKYYKPAREESFSQTDIDNDFRESFNDSYGDAYEEYIEGIDEVSARPEPQDGDIATIINLNGSINLIECGYPSEGISSQPRGGYSAPMSVADYITVYFNTNYGQQFMEIIQNPGASESQRVPPVRVGAKVTLATWNPQVDEQGNEIPLPDNVVVVTAAPPAQYIETDDTGAEIASNYAPEEINPWYVFVLKDNLDIFALEELREGDYRITNFEGEYPRIMKKEDGSMTRNVEDYVNDLITNGFTPAGFGIGSIGFVRYDGNMPGTVQFYNPDLSSRRLNIGWYVPLLPSNVIPLTGSVTSQTVEKEGEKDWIERRERERVGKLESRRTKTDSTERVIIWVDNKSGEVKQSATAPGNSWIKCPKITIFGTEIASNLDAIASHTGELSGYDINIIEIKAGSSGQATAIKIGGDDQNRLVDALADTAAPIRAKKFDTFHILRYR